MQEQNVSKDKIQMREEKIHIQLITRNFVYLS